MKKFSTLIVCALSVGTLLPAFAAPDYTAIARAHKAKAATPLERKDEVAMGNKREESTISGQAKCPPARLVLPLDHGPHAQTTPAQNQIGKDSYAAKVAGCREAAK